MVSGFWALWMAGEIPTPTFLNKESRPFFLGDTLRLLNALNSEDRALKVRFFPCDDSI